jgi:hypothetical protein
VDESEFLAQRTRRRVPLLQRGAENCRQILYGSLGAIGVRPDQVRDRVERIEQKVRLHARLQRVHARVGELRTRSCSLRRTPLGVIEQEARRVSHGDPRHVEREQLDDHWNDHACGVQTEQRAGEEQGHPRGNQDTRDEGELRHRSEDRRQLFLLLRAVGPHEGDSGHRTTRLERHRQPENRDARHGGGHREHLGDRGRPGPAPHIPDLKSEHPGRPEEQPVSRRTAFLWRLRKRGANGRPRAVASHPRDQTPRAGPAA